MTDSKTSQHLFMTKPKWDTTGENTFLVSAPNPGVAVRLSAAYMEFEDYQLNDYRVWLVNNLSVPGKPRVLAYGDDVKELTL